MKDENTRRPALPRREFLRNSAAAAAALSLAPGAALARPRKIGPADRALDHSRQLGDRFRVPVNAQIDYRPDVAVDHVETR